MSHQVEFQLLTLAGIAHRCTQETNRFFQHQSYDPRYCFELFRRAILHRNQRAWELVYAQYRSQVARWVERHPAFPTCGEETQYLVNRAFERMWIALSPEKFHDFSNLKSLLRYLQMCVHSAIIDLVRTTEGPTVVDLEVDAPTARNTEKGSIVEDHALSRVQRKELWQEINARLRDEKEYQVIYGSFVLGLKPREICAQFQDIFRNVSEVYRIKENVLARLRRDAELEKFLK